jgi:hypothetical protein
MAARVHPGNLGDAEIVASLTAVVLDDRHAGNHLGPANTPQVHSKYTVPGIRFDPCPSDRPLRRLRPNDEVLARHPGKPSHHRSGHDHGAPSARPVHVVDRHREWRLHLRHALILNRRVPCGPPSSGQPACYDDATRRRQAPTNGDRRRHQSILVTAPSRTSVLIVGSTPSVRDQIPDRLPPLRGPFDATVAAGSRRSQGRSRVPSPRQWQSMRAGRWANGYRVVLAYTCDG